MSLVHILIIYSLINTLLSTSHPITHLALNITSSKHFLLLVLRLSLYIMSSKQFLPLGDTGL